jgi:FMN phosphatase YigB (HAD superfamily)
MRTLILFDNGGVLTHIDFGPVFEELQARTGKSVAEIRERLAKSKAIAYGIIGKNNEFFERYREAVGLALTDQEIVDFETVKASLRPVREVMGIKQRLAKAGHTIGILSNSYSFVVAWQRERWPELLDTYGGPAIFSDTAGVAKPDPRIYHLVPHFDRIIYIEDKSSYLKYPVEELGWTGILITAFQDPNEPIRAIGHGEEAVKGMHVVRDPKELERVLRDLGVEF